MPVPACPQRPVPEPGSTMEEPLGEGLRNSNNNASPGGWGGARAGGHPLAPFGGPGPQPSYLGRVVLEIVESERTYARDLRSIVEGYLGKIIDAEEPVLRPEQVSALFGNIEDIYELSSTLLQNLESCASDPVAVAVCFVTRSQEFAIYTQYCNNYPSSVAALSECMRSKAQARFLRQCQEGLRHSLPLGAYLLKPVQRVLKYHLLLQEISKHFEHKSGEDYEVVLEAIDTMTCVAWCINDMKRKHEHAIRQQEIQSLLLGWKGPDLTSYGELVLEGRFRAQRVRHERVLFLFDKTLLITRPRGEHYVYKSHIPCSSLMLIESTRDSLCFSLAHYKHGKQQHNLQAKNVEEKRIWTHHIKRLILENHHAIVPQKAKEAILEMDLFYPPRLPRCSPERLKKSWSCQPLPLPRRQSEPFQQQEQEQAVPERVRGPPGRRQSEPAEQILRQLGQQGLKVRVGCRGLGVPPTLGVQLARGVLSPVLPPEQHAGSEGVLLEMEGTPQHPRAWPEPGDTVEEEEEEEAGDKENQEELPGTGEQLLEPQEEQAGGHPPVLGGPKRPSSWGPGSCEKVSATPQPHPGGPQGLTPYPPSPPRAGQHPEGSGGPQTPSSSGPGGSQGEAEQGGEEFQGPSSEEEEEEEEEEEDEGEGDSILPPSVLDQASVIAQRFGGGGTFSRRSSLAPGSRSGSALSLDGAGPPGDTGGEGSRSSVPSPEPAAGTRRESLLSNRDRLLLEKIRSYYGHAEHRDAAFSVRRRESLSFIPKGLVRSNISRLNGLPRPPAGPQPTPRPPHGGPEASPEEEPCRENGLQTPEPLLILEDEDLGATETEPPPPLGSPPPPAGSPPPSAGSPPSAGPPPGVLLTPPPPSSTKVYQLARQYSLRIKSRRAGTRRSPPPPPGGHRPLWHRHRPPRGDPATGRGAGSIPRPTHPSQPRTLHLARRPGAPSPIRRPEATAGDPEPIGPRGTVPGRSPHPEGTGRRAEPERRNRGRGRHPPGTARQRGDPLGGGRSPPGCGAEGGGPGEVAGDPRTPNLRSDPLAHHPGEDLLEGGGGTLQSLPGIRGIPAALPPAPGGTPVPTAPPARPRQGPQAEVSDPGCCQLGGAGGAGVTRGEGAASRPPQPCPLGAPRGPQRRDSPWRPGVLGRRSTQWTHNLAGRRGTQWAPNLVRRSTQQTPTYLEEGAPHRFPTCPEGAPDRLPTHVEEGAPNGLPTWSGGAPNTPPTYLEEGAPHRFPTYLEEGTSHGNPSCLGEGAPNGLTTWPGEGAPNRPPTYLEEGAPHRFPTCPEGAPHRFPTYLEEGTFPGDPAWPGEGAPHGLPPCPGGHPVDLQLPWKWHPMDAQPVQEQRHPVTPPSCPGIGAPTDPPAHLEDGTPWGPPTHLEEGAPVVPPAHPGAGAPHRPPTYLEEEAPVAPPAHPRARTPCDPPTPQPAQD
ncbi:pleckstrin homology domain-containing family G member 3 isoform X3 [Heliangelus exortis]|uniref:pleckstrin homology domain-containing family G member 3 isoform X3 n=1 Tax=Heliangelus exortis TaxID=472823 RepID=UPI003A902763